MSKKRGFALLLAFVLSFVSLIPLGAAAQAAPTLPKGIKTLQLQYLDSSVSPANWNNPAAVKELTDGVVLREGDKVRLLIQYTPAAQGKEYTFSMNNKAVIMTGRPTGNTSIESITPYDGVDANGEATNGVTYKWYDAPNPVQEGVTYMEYAVQSPGDWVGQKISLKINGEDAVKDVIIIKVKDVIIIKKDDVPAPSAQIDKKVHNGSSFVDTTVFKDKIVNNGVLDQDVFDKLFTDPQFTFRLSPVVQGKVLHTDANPYIVTDELPQCMEIVPGTFTAQKVTWNENLWNRTAGPVETMNPQPTIVTGDKNTKDKVTIDTLDFDGAGATQYHIEYKARFKADCKSDMQAAFIAEANGKMAEYYNLTANGYQNDTVLERKDKSESYTDKAVVNLRGYNKQKVGPNTNAAFTKDAGQDTVTNPDGTVRVIDWKNDGWGSARLDKNDPDQKKLETPLPITYKLGVKLTDFKPGTADDLYYTLTHNVVVEDTLVSALSWDPSRTFVTSADIYASDGSVLIPAGTVLTAVTGEETDLKAAATDDAKRLAFRDNDAYVGKYWIDGQVLRINVGKHQSTSTVISAPANINTIDGLTQASGNAPIADSQGWKNVPNKAKFYFDRTDGSWSSVDRDVNHKIVVLPPQDKGTNDVKTFNKVGSGIPDSIVLKPGETLPSFPVTYTFTIGANKGVDLATMEIDDKISANTFDLGPNNDLSNVTVTSNQPWAPMTKKLVTDSEGNLHLVLSLTPQAQAAIALDQAKRNSGLTVTLVLNTRKGEILPDGTPERIIEVSNHAEVRSGDSFFWANDSREVNSYGAEAAPKKYVFNKDATNDLERWATSIKAPTSDGSYSDDFFYRVDYVVYDGYQGAEAEGVKDKLPEDVTFEGFYTYDPVTNQFSDLGKGTQPIDNNLEALCVNDQGQACTTGDPVQTVQIKQQAGQKLSHAGTTSIYFKVSLKKDAAGNKVDAKKIVNTVRGWTPVEITPKNYAVGDYTWIDANKNGLQDQGEKVLPGVKVELLDRNGQPVMQKDADGNLVLKDGKTVPMVTYTDANGWYMFDELIGDQYQVRFTLTDDQAKKYKFTTPTATVEGKDTHGLDSNAHVGSDPKIGTSKVFTLDGTNTDLTKNYREPGTVKATEGIDPTWDAGVIVKSAVVTDPTAKEQNPKKLKKTGASVVIVGLTAAALIGAGGVLVKRRRDA